jgi:hypothetical protein
LYRDPPCRPRFGRPCDVENFDVHRVAVVASKIAKLCPRRRRIARLCESGFERPNTRLERGFSWQMTGARTRGPRPQIEWISKFRELTPLGHFEGKRSS